MMGDESFQPITAEEKEMLEHLASGWGVTLEFDRVSDYAASLISTNSPLRTGALTDQDQNKRAAAMLVTVRTMNTEIEFSNDAERHWCNYFEQLDEVVWLGKSLIDSYDVYWRFEPTVERILELNAEQAELAFLLIIEFQNGDYGLARNQQGERFMQTACTWRADDYSAANINTGLDACRYAFGLIERCFPLLLGLKRIIDGDTPSLEQLQSMRDQRIRRELTDVETHENSAYFDLLVNAYNPTIRNAVAHGDVVHDPQRQLIRIPNRGLEYSYEKFAKIASEQIAIALFFHGMFEALVDCSFLFHQIEEYSRNDLPL